MRLDDCGDLVFYLVLVERLICVVLGFILILHAIARVPLGSWIPYALAFWIGTLLLMLTWAVVDYRHYLAQHPGMIVGLRLKRR